MAYYIIYATALVYLVDAIQLSTISQQVDQLDTMGNTLDTMGEYVQTKYNQTQKKFKDRIEQIGSEIHMNDLKDRPTESSLVQTQVQTAFLGDMMWDIFDVITFGLFEKEKKHNTIKDRQPKPQEKQAPPPQQAPPKQEEEPKNETKQEPAHEKQKPMQALQAAVVSLKEIVEELPTQEDTPPMKREDSEDGKNQTMEDAPTIKKEDSEEGKNTTEEAPVIQKEVTNETVEAVAPEIKIEKEVTNETAEANKTAPVKIQKEVTDEKAPEKKPEPKPEVKKDVQEGYTDKDIADVKYTPRKDDNIDDKNATDATPRSPLPGGREEVDYDKLSNETNLDAFQKKVRSAYQAHRSANDLTEADAVFHSYSHEVANPAAGDDSTEQRDINKEGALAALFEVMRNWGLDLTDDQESSIKRHEFAAQFKNFKNGKGNLPVQNAKEFLKAVIDDITDGSDVVGSTQKKIQKDMEEE